MYLRLKLNCTVENTFYNGERETVHQNAHSFVGNTECNEKYKNEKKSSNPTIDFSTVPSERCLLAHNGEV